MFEHQHRQEFSDHCHIISHLNPEVNEVVMAFVDQKHNTETLRNGYPIIIFQGGPLYEPYFIAIDNREQVIIGPNKKTVAIYMVGELEVLI